MIRTLPVTATFAALAGVAVVLAACAPTASDSSGMREVSVTMTDDLRFEPDALTVAAGETVRFVVHNAGEVDHEFLIGDEAAQASFADEMADGHGDQHAGEAGIALGPGESGEFTYTFEAPGELLIGCHEPGHYDGGMIGRITVRP
jgi:uncharacterized cupredoxin-like copper-binding protein